MKILDCSKFANEHNAKRHPTDGYWFEEIEWKSFLNNGYTHVLLNDKVCVMGKFGAVGFAVPLPIRVYYPGMIVE